MQNFTTYPDANISIDTGTRYIPSMFSISLESEQKEGREYIPFIAVKVFITFLLLQSSDCLACNFTKE